MPPIRAFCKGWTPTGPAGTLPGTVAVWPSDRDGARATWARPAASRRRSVKVHVRVSRAEQFGNKRCPADLVVREGDHGCRLRGNTCRFAAPGSPAASRRFRPFACHGSNGSNRPNCDIGRAVSWRPLPDPTADLWTLSVLAKEAGRPWTRSGNHGDANGDGAEGPRGLSARSS